jgi:hypothetical protein
MPKVGQHGCPAAPHASHVLAMQILLVAVHAEPEPTHWFDVGSQHRAEVHAGPEVQHGSCSYPHVCIGVAVRHARDVCRVRKVARNRIRCS